MSRPARSQAIKRRCGYTLLEMLLVLAVLLALAAIAWPRVMRVYGDQQLKSAAEEVRVELAGTRIRAVDSGLIYQFRYEPGGVRYVSVPYERDDFEAFDSGGMAPSRIRCGAGELPAGMRFEPLEGFESGEPIMPDVVAGLPDAPMLGGANWSPPVLFRPDGSGEDVAFDVMDARQQFIRIHYSSFPRLHFTFR
jgi:prepilin-type N-terminal cleavage/methylation domain-containing protein